jgi:superfamily I DNA/RNA helicase
MKDDLWIAAAKFWSDFESYAERDHASQAGKLRIDPSELINRAVTALNKDQSLAKKISELFEVVIIDHFEESDPSHRRLLDALAPKAFAIFHDGASTVSRFRGADPEGLEAFLDRFAEKKNVKRYELTQVLRPVPVKRFIEADSVADEADSIATHLRSLHLRQSIPWSEMAVLVRSPGDHLAAIRRA